MRISSSGQTMILNACFDEDVTYLFCTLRIIETKPVHFSWSTVSAVCIFLSSLSPLPASCFSPQLPSQVVRKDITNIPDASLSYMDGLQAVYGVSFGGLKICPLFPFSFFFFFFSPGPPPSPALIISQFVLMLLSLLQMMLCFS